MNNNFINTIDKPAFDLNDFSLVPAILSDIESRKDVNIHLNYSPASLPIIVSPMCSVISKDNWRDFLFEGLFPCMPRGQYINSSLVINSISLEEFEFLIAKIKSNIEIPKYTYLLVDIANAHSKRVYNLTKEFMSLNTDIKLIIGNVANPLTYKLYAELGIWGVRISVGSGSACLTAVQTGIFYSMGSLISECYKFKKENNYDTHIIGDGGFNDYASILKGLSLGCNFIMIGGALNKCLESSGDTYLFNIKINSIKDLIWNIKFLRPRMKKHFYGMSTKYVQEKWGRKETITSEGIHKMNRVEYTLKGWVANFKDYLRSSMSYVGAMNLEEYKDCEKMFISTESFRRFSK